MWKQTCLRLRQDFYKWISLVFILVICHQLIRWLPFGLTMGIFLFLPVCLGIPLYWANRQKFSPLAPWIFWSVLLVGVKSFRLLVSAVLLPAWLQNPSIPLAQTALRSNQLFLIGNILLIIVYIILFPCMLSVWEQGTIWGGYKRTIDHWKKFLVFILLVICKDFLPFLTFITTKLLGKAGSSFFMDALNWALWIVILYFFAIWVAQFPCKKNSLQSSKRQPAQVISADLIQKFFSAVAAQKLDAVRQYIEQFPLLIYAVSSETGNTALHLAALNGWSEMASLLAAAEPNCLRVKNNMNKYPYELAQEKGFDEVAHALRIE